MQLKSEIQIEDLEKLDIRIGTILNAEKVEGSSKLIKLKVDFGELGKRTILTGMQMYFEPKDFIGMQTIFLLNLKPRKIMGLDSQGMILALGLNDNVRPTFLTPREDVENGEGVR